MCLPFSCLTAKDGNLIAKRLEKTWVKIGWHNWIIYLILAFNFITTRNSTVREDTVFRCIHHSISVSKIDMDRISGGCCYSTNEELNHWIFLISCQLYSISDLGKSLCTGTCQSIELVVCFNNIFYIISWGQDYWDRAWMIMWQCTLS